MIEVANPDGALSNAILVPVEKPRVRLNVLFFWRFWQPWITREVQLLLLVVFAGALGSYLHGMMSIADFIGGRKLKVSWFWWYLTRPFLGMAMGLIFYAMLRGGFLVGTPADEKFVSPFGVIAIGTLVGMFSDKAAQKLGEIFDVVFRAATPRPDKLDETVPVISKLEPNKVKAGSPETIVTITGEHLSSVKNVKVNEELRTAGLMNDKQITVTLNATDLLTPSSIIITVVDANGDVSAAATFEVTAKDDAEVTEDDAVG